MTASEMARKRWRNWSEQDRAQHIAKMVAGHKKAALKRKESQEEEIQREQEE